MSRAIVTYFSITGVTADAAKQLASAIGADLFEIKPEGSYSAPKTKTGDIPSPSEMEFTADQPIAFQHLDLGAYDVIYLGLPIWWYAAPTIVNNFLDNYDLSGKTIIPFATSGGGGIDKVKPRLLKSCRGADLKDASLLLGDLTQDELRQWASEIQK